MTLMVRAGRDAACTARALLSWANAEFRSALTNKTEKLEYPMRSLP